MASVHEGCCVNLKGILKTVAPALGAAIGGPFGGIAGKLIASKLGKDEPKSENDLLRMVQGALGDPEQVLKLKEAGEAFEIRMRELDVDVFALEIDDRKNARDNGAKVSFWPQIVISSIFILSFSVICYVVFSGMAQLEGESKDVIVYLLGILSAGVTQIMNFWFGSSMGSKEKTQSLKVGHS